MSPTRLPVRARVLVIALALLAGCARRPSFDAAAAQKEIAVALERSAEEISLFGETRGATQDEWIVEFQLRGQRDAFEARFSGENRRWQLTGLRERGVGRRVENAWMEPGALLGRLRRDDTERSTTTREVLTDVAAFLERHAAVHEGTFPQVDAGGLRDLLVGGAISIDEWHHDTDGWGNGLVYHAAPDGRSYVLVSPGADGRLDMEAEEYFAKADVGDETYDGATDDPAYDFVVASGSLVQSYEP